MLIKWVWRAEAEPAQIDSATRGARPRSRRPVTVSGGYRGPRQGHVQHATFSHPSPTSGSAIASRSDQRSATHRADRTPAIAAQSHGGSLPFGARSGPSGACGLERERLAVGCDASRRAPSRRERAPHHPPPRVPPSPVKEPALASCRSVVAVLSILGQVEREHACQQQ
jgi:hypothetical protein